MRFYCISPMLLFNRMIHSLNALWNSSTIGPKYENELTSMETRLVDDFDVSNKHPIAKIVERSGLKEILTTLSSSIVGWVQFHSLSSMILKNYLAKSQLLSWECFLTQICPVNYIIISWKIINYLWAHTHAKLKVRFSPNTPPIPGRSIWGFSKVSPH